MLASVMPSANSVASLTGSVMGSRASSAPEVAMGLLRGTGLFGEVSLYGALIHVVTEDPEAHRPQIEGALRDKDIEIRSIEIIAPSLEDVFIASARE